MAGPCLATDPEIDSQIYPGAVARAVVPSVIAAGLLGLLSGCGGAQASAPPELPIDLLAAVTGQVDCGGDTMVMVRQYRYDFSGDGVQDALVAVRCDTGAGSPPSSVFALQAGEQGPLVVGKLLDGDAGEVVTEVTGQGSEAIVKGFAFSPTAPRCCPDLDVMHRYQWVGTAFGPGVRTATPLPTAQPSDDEPSDLPEDAAE